MTLLEMVQVVSDKTGVPKTRVKKVLKAFFHEVRSTAMSGESVTLHEFGRFDQKVTKDGMKFGKSVQGRKVLRFKESRYGQVRSRNRGTTRQDSSQGTPVPKVRD